ncbi:unnamed protein product [Alopecurus aequalis]
MDSVVTSSARRWALCSLLCLCLFSAGLLLGSRPFFPTPQLWEHLSRAQRLAPPPASPLADAAAETYHDHDVVAPAPMAGSGDIGHEEEYDDEELAIGSAPAPAPAPAWQDGDGEECDLFDGRWVHDPAGYPLYEAAECPLLSDQVTCRRNGRPDNGYEHWRWQPKGCRGSTRFHGTEALEQCRNRRLVFVGDSLNRNMWESLACILYTALPDRSRTRIEDVSSEYRIFHAMDYNCSVEFFWSPFLVNLETKQDRTRALKLDQLPTMLKQVIGADVVIFNTGHWWTHTGKLRAWDHLERNGVLVDMEGEEAFNRALRTWARWVDHNLDPTRTRVFFRMQIGATIRLLPSQMKQLYHGSQEA